MLDNNAAEIIRVMKVVNSNVNKPAKINSIKNDLSKKDNDSNKSEDFKEKLNKVLSEKHRFTVDSEKPYEDEEILVDSSLKDKIKEQSRISSLVKEKFTLNPELQEKIDFNSSDNMQDILSSLNTNDDIEEDEELLGEIEIKALGNNITNDNNNVSSVNKSNKDKLIEELKYAIANQRNL